MTKDQQMRLKRVESEVSEIKSLIAEVHTGFKWFIRGAKFTAALGVLVLALKGAVSWHEVRDAFKGIA